jgi:LAO/AO transport system kinase
MEIADIFVVNKADHDGADRLVQAVTSMLSLHEFAADAWRPPVLKTVASEATGIAELWSSIGAFRQRPPTEGMARQRTRQEHRLRDLVSRQFLLQVDACIPDAEWKTLVEAVANREKDPYTAAGEIINRAAAARAADPASVQGRTLG